MEETFGSKHKQRCVGKVFCFTLNNKFFPFSIISIFSSFGTKSFKSIKDGELFLLGLYPSTTE